MPPKKKKTNRRNSVEFPALDKTYNLKTRSELFDQDYINKLSYEDKRWLNQFNNEYINASFKTGSGNKNLHKGKAAKRERYNNNNHRNACQYTIAKATGGLNEIEEAKHSSVKNIEEIIQDEKRLDVLEEIQKIVKNKNDLKVKIKWWYDRDYSPERILRKLKQLNNLNNSLNSTEKSKNPAKKKH